MVASAHDDGDMWSAMVELAADTALRAEKAREGNGEVSAFGQARGVLKTRPARQDVHGAWQREQRSSDMCCPRGVCCLMNVSHCRSHSDNGNRLIAPVRR